MRVGYSVKGSAWSMMAGQTGVDREVRLALADTHRVVAATSDGPPCMEERIKWILRRKISDK